MSTANSLLTATHSRIAANQGKVLKIILAILAVIAIIIGLALYFTGGLSSAAREQLTAIQSGNIESAYSMTSKAFQESTSLDKFKSYVEQNPILKDYNSISFTERNVENGVGYLRGIIKNADGMQMKIEYQLVKEDNKWKIQGMQLTPIEKTE